MSTKDCDISKGDAAAYAKAWGDPAGRNHYLVEGDGAAGPVVLLVDIQSTRPDKVVGVYLNESLARAAARRRCADQSSAASHEESEEILAASNPAAALMSAMADRGAKHITRR
jgi:hypothetical protein